MLHIPTHLESIRLGFEALGRSPSSQWVKLRIKW